jgi:hypothetical protein
VRVSALSARAYTATLYVMVNIVERGGRAPLTLTRVGEIFHHDGIYARKRLLTLCVYSVVHFTLPLFLLSVLEYEKSSQK